MKFAIYEAFTCGLPNHVKIYLLFRPRIGLFLLPWHHACVNDLPFRLLMVWGQLLRLTVKNFWNTKISQWCTFKKKLPANTQEKFPVKATNSAVTNDIKWCTYVWNNEGSYKCLESHNVYLQLSTKVIICFIMLIMHLMNFLCHYPVNKLA